MSITQLDHAPTPTTILYQDKATFIAHAISIDDDFWVTLPELTACTGWEIKPEGICRGEICILVPDSKLSAMMRQESEESWFNLAEFARFLEQPYVRNDAHNVWTFGVPPGEWRSQMDTYAPDIILPDLDSKMYSLSDFRGKKVFLVCWASW